MNKIIVTHEEDIELLISRIISQKFIEFRDLFDKPDTHSHAEDLVDQNLSIKQLAEYWSCHEQTIMNKKRSGELPFYQTGRKVFFKKSEIDNLTANPIAKNKGAKI